jgi:hypothetical protein
MSRGFGVGLMGMAAVAGGGTLLAGGSALIGGASGFMNPKENRAIDARKGALNSFGSTAEAMGNVGLGAGVLFAGLGIAGRMGGAAVKSGFFDAFGKGFSKGREIYSDAGLDAAGKGSALSKFTSDSIADGDTHSAFQGIINGTTGTMGASVGAVVGKMTSKSPIVPKLPKPKNTGSKEEVGMTAANVASGTMFTAGIVGLGLYAGASAADTGIMGGSPLSIANRSAGQEIYNREQMKASQYEMLAQYNPQQGGMRDIDGAYSYNRGINTSSTNPMSPGLARTAGPKKGITAGQFGDSGSLVFAMNNLRRG